ncbi:cytochrome c biogenesis protein CcdA [Cupriavidus sp. EM10]|uniref:cytochrome c biogenesis protein CcdA n=1 Tax=Cupriavidus sp. EM10 TaxID=2839983 RepID=UPI0021076E1B|nr:cytochrome c biogenesis protein CcdA [Cupriavidus sp. EM10]
MVPILSAIVVGAEARRWRSLGLSAAYVLGMSVIYTGVGVTAGIIGESLTAFLQAPWVLASFAMLLSVLALAMFGVYELQLPQSWLSRLQASSGKLHGGQFIGAALMGAMSALIVGPCVTAPLAGALAYIARSGDAMIGGSALFSMALGMGTPLLLVGAGAGALLPRTGGWMVHTKTASGYMLLALALWMANPIMPSWIFMLAVATLLLAVGVALGALAPIPVSAPLAQVRKAIGLLAVTLSVVLILGLARAAGTYCNPLVSSPSSQAPLGIRVRLIRIGLICTSNRLGMLTSWMQGSRRLRATSVRSCWISTPIGVRVARRWNVSRSRMPA